MNTFSKQLIFATLFFVFLIYTVMVDTIGTNEDKGRELMNEKSKSGKLLYQKYNCTSCHQLYGLGGYLGPDLTNVAASPNNQDWAYARIILQNGTLQMPNFNLKENEIDELLAYLSYVNETGISPVKKFEIRYDGTINQVKDK
ncbi:MAG: c-type cytochrome [Bacteroidia bacterium]